MKSISEILHVFYVGARYIKWGSGSSVIRIARLSLGNTLKRFFRFKLLETEATSPYFSGVQRSLIVTGTLGVAICRNT